MSKVILIEHAKCTGCRTCELVCSIKKNGSSNPLRARISVVKWEDTCLEVPMVCQQCESAPCMSVCPVRAIERDQQLGRINVNYDICIGCKFCVAVCPFGAMKIDGVSHKVVKCDLCDGDPVCVKACETKALQFIDESRVSLNRMRQAALALQEYFNKTQPSIITK